MGVRRREKDEHRMTLLERSSREMGEEKQFMDGTRGGKRWLQHVTSKGTSGMPHTPDVVIRILVFSQGLSQTSQGPPGGNAATAERRGGKQRRLLGCAALPGGGSTSSIAAGPLML